MAERVSIDFSALDAWCADRAAQQCASSEADRAHILMACVQIPQHLLWHASEILDMIQQRVGPTVELVIVADSAFPDCCIDSISSAHRDASVIFKVGSPCATIATRSESVTVVVLPVQHAIEDFPLDGAKNAIARECSASAYEWTGIAVRGSDQFALLAASLFPESQTDVCHVHPDDLGAIPRNAVGRLVVADDAVGRQLALILPSYDILFAHGDCTVVRSRRERAKRWAMIEKLAGDAVPIGLVVHSSSRVYADLAYEYSKLLRSRGHPTYMLSAGRLTGPKLGNFSDLRAFVIFGCTRTMLAPEADFFSPLLTPFEALCFLGAADFWSDPYELDVSKLLHTVRMLNSAGTGVDDCTDLSLANCEFSISTFGSREFKGVPSVVASGSPAETASMFDILPGTTGTPRSYTRLDSV